MSCEIRQKANVSELSRVKRILFPGEHEELEDDGWSGTDAWSWKTDFEESTPPSKPSDNWLQSCLVSCTPHSEVIAIAFQDRYVVLASKWEKGEQQKEVQKYHVVYPASNSSFVGEEISAILCLPITSNQKTSQGMPDWICIVVGYTSGMVRMFTVDGNLLMTEAFHGEPVRQIKFHTSVKNHAQQELTVLYEKVFIVVEGLGLFNSLKASRNYLAKGRAMFGSSDASAEHPPLHYRKFGLQEQHRINTSFLLGTSAPTNFDHLVTASVVGGFHARYNNAPPIATGILSLGSQPYCAWHFAVEGSAAPLLSDVAYALASRVTSKILSKTSGWLGWGGGGASKPDSAPSRAKEKQMMEPATSIYPRYGLADALREALSVSVSPNQKLAALTDSLGRVVLIDLHRGIAVRMWKGYRDAQCGWVTSWESDEQSTLTQSTNRRIVSFLVIYISKRGIIEIWTPQQGARIAAFNCVKGARLLSLGTGLSVDKDIAQCCLLGPDGRMDEIFVPFHCALKGDSSQRARDLHLLQQFRSQISREITENSFELLLEIRHASVVSQALDALVGSELLVEASALVTCLESLISHYNESKALDAESRLVLARCQLISNLVRVFVFVENERKAPPDYETTFEASTPSIEDVFNTLQLNREEVSRILNQLDEEDVSMETVTSSLTLFTFLRVFDVNRSHSSESNTDGKVKLKSSLNDSDRAQLGHWLWGTLFSRGVSVVDKFLVALKESQITSEDLASLLFHYWLESCSGSCESILRLHSVVQKICRLAAPDKLTGGDFPSPWWQKINDIFINATKLKLACCATLVCRSIISKFDKEKLNQARQSKMEEEDVSMEDSLGEWEDMSVDMVHWSALTKQLEDLYHLSRLLRYVPMHLRQSRIHDLELRLDETSESLDFTLASILRKGRGSVSELIGRWIVQNLLEPTLLFPEQHCTENVSDMSEDSDRSVEQAPEADKMPVGSSEEVFIIKELFQNVAKQLPHSTEHDVILVNTAIEYAALWMKTPKHLKFLELCLSTVSVVRSNLLRHGTCRTLWSMIFAPMFHDLTLLMDKIGRLPKTFSGRKVNLPSPDLAEPFFQLTMKLLDTTVTAAMSCEVEPPPFLRYDDIWPTCEGATPMIEVALRQRLVNIDLVLLHHQLAQSLHLISSLEIRGVHCLSLFDQRVGRFAFFKELHTYPPLPAHGKDPLVEANQLQFLKQVIVKAVEQMEQRGNAPLDFVNQAIKLGYEWNVDVDELRIKYVELLYTNGKDHLASEVLPSIGSGAKLAPVLLSSTGRRLKSLLKPADTSVLSPLTTEWLAAFSTPQDQFEEVADTSIDQIVQVLVEALRRFPSECSDQKIAGELHALLITKQITN